MAKTASFFMYLHAETDKAMLFSTYDRHQPAHWLPKSLISTKQYGEHEYTVLMPIWLAYANKLIARHHKT